MLRCKQERACERASAHGAGAVRFQPLARNQWHTTDDVAFTRLHWEGYGPGAGAARPGPGSGAVLRCQRDRACDSMMRAREHRVHGHPAGAVRPPPRLMPGSGAERL